MAHAMSQVEYKPTKCQNCGDYSHCGSANWRDERDYNGDFYLVKTCEHCRCSNCSNPGYQNDNN